MKNTTTATTTATTAQKQSILAVSEECKAFFNDCRATFGCAGKSKDYVAATEKEVGDACLAFIEAHRFEEQVKEREVPMIDPETGLAIVDETGEPLMELEEYLEEVDLFAFEVNRTLALRATTSRSTATVKLAAKEKELDELRALLATLQAKAENA